jgi:hypothetical protein
MTPVIEKESELVANATTAHSVVLRFVKSAIAAHGEPVMRIALEWYADTARIEDLRGSISGGELKEFQETLGLRPRRGKLLLVLRDLVEMGCLKPAVGGFTMTDKGKEIVSSFRS